MPVTASPSRFYTGTSNIVLPVANKQAFPEAYRDSSRLTYYASLFNSLEVNSSFYKIPLSRTTARWSGEVPEEFRFTFKLHRDLTHVKAALPDPEQAMRFMQSINAAADKAGCLLIQFPAGRTYNPLFLARMLALLQTHNDSWKLCVEFRDRSWYRDETYRQLEGADAALVIHDMRKSKTPLLDPWTSHVYYRFHGPKGDYRGTYELDDLQDYAGQMGEQLDAGKTVYAYFNNTIGTAVFDALTLQELVTGKATFAPDNGIPPSPMSF